MLPVCRAVVGDNVTEGQEIWLFSWQRCGSMAEIFVIET